MLIRSISKLINCSHCVAKAVAVIIISILISQLRGINGWLRRKIDLKGGSFSKSVVLAPG
jgi:hypothetical protein